MVGRTRRSSHTQSGAEASDAAFALPRTTTGSRMRQVAVVAWFSAQAALQALPLPPGDPAIATWPTDELVHVFFGAGGVFVLRYAGARRGALPVVFGIAALFEAMQAVLPMRTPQWLDLLAAATGACTAWVLLQHDTSRRATRPERHPDPRSPDLVATASRDGDG